MNLLLRMALCAWTCVTLSSCESVGNLLMAPVTLLERTAGSIGHMAGASVDNPNATSNSVAERGKIIESRGDYRAPEQPQNGSAVAQR